MTKIFNFPINFNTPHVSFRSNTSVVPTKVLPVNDEFLSNPLIENLGNKIKIEAAAKSNPRIAELAKTHNIPIKVNEKELDKLKNEHLQNTRVLAAKIYSALPEEQKREINISQIQTAAMFHDYGKVLIPDNILNKNGKLNAEEKEIVNLHSEFGYELLKNKNLDKRTLELIKYHHQTPDGSGYPENTTGYVYGTDSQILSIADKYCALLERRSYKPAFSKIEALAILADDVKQGLYSQEVYNALTKTV